MTIERFIERAIEGGWKRPSVAYVYGADAMDEVWPCTDRDEIFQLEDIFLMQEAFLDPTFWQAVGKVEGWEANIDQYDDPELIGRAHIPYMHRMIDSLAEGKTVEEFLETL